MDTVTTTAPNTSLRQRMLQDMQMRGLGERKHTPKAAAYFAQAAIAC
ncbi:hypothetical protein [Novosphingobium sp.]